MNLRELPCPVRIYWDLPGAPSDVTRSLNICDEIVRLRILFLSVRDASFPISASCLDVLDRLKGEHIAVSLTVPASAITPAALDRLSGTRIKPVLVDASSLDEVRSLGETIGRCRDAGLPVGISFAIGRNNLRDVPGIISFCLENGISHLVFPIQRLVGKRECFYLNPMESDELALKLKGVDYRTLQLTIHDPFLWKVFYPGTDYHEGGCQAGNSMLYISPDSRVYPCPAMPVELGDLHEAPLGSIILSDEKARLRRSLLDPPDECLGCDLVGRCLGGCRGRAFALSSSFSRRDPACEQGRMPAKSD